MSPSAQALSNTDFTPQTKPLGPYRRGANRLGGYVRDIPKASELQLLHIVFEGRSGKYVFLGAGGRHETASTSKSYAKQVFRCVDNQVKVEDRWYAYLDSLWSETIRPRTVEATPYWVGAVKTLNGKSVGDIANVISSVFEQISSAGIEAFDQALKQVDLLSANEYFMVAVLRAASPHRKNLSGWSDAIAATQSLLKTRGLDADKILKGLDAG